MTAMSEEISAAQKIDEEIKALEALLEDRKLALPAHSIRPHQLLEIEELEERIQNKREERDRLARENG